MNANNELLPQHQKLLDESAISPEVAKLRGYRSAKTQKELLQLGFSERQRRVPALIIPVWNVHGEIGNYQIRPDTPRINEAGKPAKYETPGKSRMLIDVPPSARGQIGDPSVPLFITEGIRKADAAVSMGLCCIALLGVWNWRGSNDGGGKVALPDWESIAVNGREVHICFDSDVMLKPQVFNAMVRLKAFLEQRGAKVSLIYLPSGSDGSKVGLDDFLAAGHSVDDLLQHASSELRTPEGFSEDSERGYRFGPAGILWMKPTRDGSVATPLTNFTARIVSEVIEDDGAECRRLFEVEASLGGRSARFSVLASQFPGLTWTAEYLGALAVVYPGLGIRDQARAAIQLLSENVTEKHRYTHTGWREIEGQWVYLHAGGGIGENGTVPGVDVRLPATLAAYELPEPPDGEDLQGAIRDSLGLLDLLPDMIGFPLHSAIWLAPLGISDFSVHLAGQTGTGKTVLATLIQQHWGSGMDSRHLPGSWSSTGNALEGMSFLAKDAVFVVDDFCPTGSNTDIARLHRDADRLLRAQGNRSARQRMTADATVRPAKPPRGLIISTGEDVPRGESLRARILVLEMKPDALVWEVVTECQRKASAGQYARAMAGFLRWLAPRYGNLRRELQAKIEELRDSAKGHLKHRRTPDNIAKLAFSLRLFLDFAQDVAAVTSEEADTLWKRGWKALQDAGEAQSEHQVAADPARRFVDLLTAAIASGKAHVAGPDGEQPPRPEAWGWREQTAGSYDDIRTYWQPLGIRVGWVEGDHLYLQPEASYGVAQQMTRDGGDSLNVLSKTLHKRLRERGLLASTDETRNTLTVRKMLAGSRRQVLHMRSGAIMPRETDQSDQTDQEQSAPCLETDSPGQSGGQVLTEEREETDHDNCPKECSASTEGGEPGTLVSLVSSVEDPRSVQDEQASLAQRIEGAINAKGVPYEFAPGQKITNARGFAQTEARDALSPHPAVSKPARERLSAIGVCLEEAGFE